MTSRSSRYDGQVLFDDSLAPGNAHGVTTVLVGACGIGFAPARAEDHELLVETWSRSRTSPATCCGPG